MTVSEGDGRLKDEGNMQIKHGVVAASRRMPEDLPAPGWGKLKRKKPPMPPFAVGEVLLNTITRARVKVRKIEPGRVFVEGCRDPFCPAIFVRPEE